MNKDQIRSAMYAVSKLNLSDDDALVFIKDFAQNQFYKDPRSFENFSKCIVCLTEKVVEN